MLKSIDFMERLESDLNSEIELDRIENFFIQLRINQKVDVYIVSDKIKSVSELSYTAVNYDELDNKAILFVFLTSEQSKDDDYSYLFENGKVSLGLRRSLNSLIDNKGAANLKKNNIITFYSYKGGVGRTTSLALTATYLSRNGKNVFVLDCDFEAPGLLNFFNSAQSSLQKSGVVEYINDKLFLKSVDINNYIYNIEKNYSGIGSINLMPAGNILSSSKHLDGYLEGLARMDLQGDSLVDAFCRLVDDIQSTFNPDVILVDSRTGFNNLFGMLTRLSKHIVVLAGDDIQNSPGTEYISKLLKNKEIDSTFVLSILSGNFSRRFSHFNQYIQGLCDFDADAFYFDRQNTLEFIGTPLADSHDLDDFISGENGSKQYHKFFSHIENILRLDSTSNETLDLKLDPTSNEALDLRDSVYVVEEVLAQSKDIEFTHELESSEEMDDVEPVLLETTSDDLSLQDKILNSIYSNLPQLYAETIDYNENYIENIFYFRPCMEDFLIPEKNLLLGDKGTGKTAFYQALKNDVFFKKLIDKSQRKHMNYKVLNVTNYEVDSFEILSFDKYLKDELFVRKFWIFYIWQAICDRGSYQSNANIPAINFGRTDSHSKIIALVNDSELFEKIENELFSINESLQSTDERLIITFDRLDNIVKPYLWNDIVSPLVKLCLKCPWDHIFPKLFLRRDLYERLGNLTNKNSFKTREIDLEWTQNEMFSYFLKIIFIYAKEDFIHYLQTYSSPPEIDVAQILKKLKTKGHLHNQLPLDTHLIKPIINLIFGSPKSKKNGEIRYAYEDIYRNIQSADKSVNLRPFIDLITFAIEDQREQDHIKGFRKNSILSLVYCTSSQARKNAVIKYLGDLWKEQGNEFVQYFCEDFSRNKISLVYKKNVLMEDAFDNLIDEIRVRHADKIVIKESTAEECKQILLANKIVTTYLVGNKTRYGFAYLYTNFLGV